MMIVNACSARLCHGPLSFPKNECASRGCDCGACKAVLAMPVCHLVRVAGCRLAEPRTDIMRRPCTARQGRAWSVRPVLLGKSHRVRSDPRPVLLAALDVAAIVNAAIEPGDTRLCFHGVESGAACGNRYDKTVAAAAEKVEWPEGYRSSFTFVRHV